MRERFRDAGRRLERVRGRVRALPGGAAGWRAAVTLLGLAVIVTGVVLLPLPGPGWLIIFAGLGILATEYAWAGHLLARTRRYVQAWLDWAQRRSLVVRGLLALAGLAIVGAALWLSWLLAT
jgi:uncharacterized protein (TIGR02611 family)